MPASLPGTEMVAMPSPADASLPAKPREPAARADGGHEIPAGATAIDPVCGMKVDPRTTVHRHEHQAGTYYFCSERCRAKFAADPAKYLEPVTAETQKSV